MSERLSPDEVAQLVADQLSVYDVCAQATFDVRTLAGGRLVVEVEKFTGKRGQTIKQTVVLTVAPAVYVQPSLAVDVRPGRAVVKGVEHSAQVWTPTREELAQTRADLLARSRHTEAELFRLAAEYELSSEERGIYEGIKTMDWLLESLSG